VNDLLAHEDKRGAAPTTEIEDTAATTDSNQIAGKKVIKPINDLSKKNTANLNDLLAKETSVPAVAPAASTVPPGNSTPAPPPTPPPAAAAQAAPPPPPPAQQVDKVPGNVIQPHNDPNSIAL
jgi:hypothetical protein